MVSQIKYIPFDWSVNLVRCYSAGAAEANEVVKPAAELLQKGLVEEGTD